MSGGGLGFTIGKREQKDRYENESLEQIGSVAGSIIGDVKLNAGKDVNITASEILAGKDIDINGQNVTIKEGENKYKQKETHEYKQTGLTVSLGGGAIEAAEKVIQPIKRANQVKDERLEALYAYKAGKELEENKEKLEQAGKGNLGLSLNVSLGTSKSESKTESQTTIGQGSTINAGGNINITANKGDITIKGSTVDGENIALKAEENINILASENKNKTEEQTSSSNANIGVSIDLTTGTMGINAGFNKAEGQIKENGTTYNQSQITAGNKLTIESGKDTNIIGSTAAGNKVEANIGGNLNIESLQDKQTYDEKNSASGINISSDIIGGKLGKPEINASANKGKIESDYQSVTNQAGIYAGQEGFDINVGGNTDLKGAVIASEAEADKNKLSTETLTYEDIQNKAEYEASSAGINVNTDKDAKLNEKGITPNIGVKAEDDAESTTKAAIAEGTIEVRGEKDKDLTGLSRDTENALNKLEQIFDKETVQEKQELAGLFGELAFNEIHELSVKNGWKEGSPEKIALHALIGGIMAELGGADALTGAVAGGINEAIQKQLGEIDDPGLHQVASAIIGGVVGKLVAGDVNTGASVAASGTKNNFLFQSQKEQKEKEIEEARANGASQEEIEMIEKYWDMRDKAQDEVLPDQNLNEIEGNSEREQIIIDAATRYMGNNDSGLVMGIAGKVYESQNWGKNELKTVALGLNFEIKGMVGAGGALGYAVDEKGNVYSIGLLEGNIGTSLPNISCATIARALSKLTVSASSMTAVGEYNNAEQLRGFYEGTSVSITYTTAGMDISISGNVPGGGVALGEGVSNSMQGVTVLAGACRYIGNIKDM